ncbi:extradiol ring-cleavage dioxygenase [Subtercola lobariae]|uniref:Protocatechuate 4,5-dioxygenase subunit beta n=1 Tax=Subtercola lobariae TaxID=1588641 RepID=A0A917BEH3_9MICO|nr:extradiol ring-cleavage dioxygenase [Subtercola lobariae]GGF38159.1 protocatechuate 4,5-dioxygenase subunit beta [Subtercola lobariae]
MATIVAGIGVPHTPAFAANVKVGDPDDETAAAYARIAEQLDAVEPDVVVMFSTDHLNTFFLDNYPAIGVGVATRTSGPNDGTPGLKHVELPVHRDLAESIRIDTALADFDVSQSQEFTLDHSWLVPLQFIRPAADLAIVPIFVNSHIPPIPTARRALKLGRTVGESIASWPEDVRVVVLGSGSFSLDVGGHYIEPQKIFGVPAPEWVERVAAFLEAGDYESLVAHASRAQMAAAGNVGGELLNWIAMLGTIGGGVPSSLDIHDQFGHGYGFWRLT